jgi:G:T/U-mismatch repair DNA glycosylase
MRLTQLPVLTRLAVIATRRIPSGGVMKAEEANQHDDTRKELTEVEARYRSAILQRIKILE